MADETVDYRKVQEEIAGVRVKNDPVLQAIHQTLTLRNQKLDRGRVRILVDDGKGGKRILKVYPIDAREQLMLGTAILADPPPGVPADPAGRQSKAGPVAVPDPPPEPEQTPEPESPPEPSEEDEVKVEATEESASSDPEPPKEKAPKATSSKAKGPSKRTPQI